MSTPDSPTPTPASSPTPTPRPTPGGPPPKGLERYVDFLEGHGEPTDGLREAEQLRVGDWRFYERVADGGRSLVVAIDGDGRTVVEGGWGSWYELLHASGDEGPEALLERVAWLLGAMPLGEGSSIDVGAAELVGAPVLAVGDDLASFVGWVSFPPATRAPHRVAVDATPGDPSADLVQLPWSALVEP